MPTFGGPDLALPWSSVRDEDKKYRKLLIIFLSVFLVFAIVIPWVSEPELSREDKEEIPENLARLLLEEQEIPEPIVEPTPPVIQDEIPEPEPEPEPESEPEPEPRQQPEPEPQQEPEPEPEPQEQVTAQARERAQASGLLQLQDNLQEMRDLLDTNTVASADATRSDAKAAELNRAVITSQATAQSGGITTDQLSRDTAGAGLSSKKDTVLESSLVLPDAEEAKSLYSDRESTRDGPPSRSKEEVRRSMDANQSAIYAIYNRALRTDPTLEGKVVISLVIEASGQISDATIVSSQLNAPDLEQRLLARIKLIQFDSGNFAQTTLNYDIDFLPYSN